MRCAGLLLDFFLLAAEVSQPVSFPNRKPAQASAQSCTSTGCTLVLSCQQLLNPVRPAPLPQAGGAGGTCVLRGCVPKKLFVYASEYREMFSDAQGFG